MSVLLSIALLFSLLFSPVTLAEPPEETDVAHDSEIVSLLSRVPASAFDQGYLSYTNFESIVDAYPGASLLPEDMTLDDWRATPEGEAWGNAMAGVAGTTLAFKYAWLADETFELTGMHPLRIKESLHAGSSLDLQYWLRGNIEKERVIDALETIDYVADKTQDESGWILLCENGDCSNGLTFDREKRNPAFIFGGELGRRWPIAVNDDLLVSATYEETIRGATEPIERSLVDLMPVSRPIEVVLSLIDGDGNASISQMNMYKPGQFFRTPGQGENIRSVTLFHTNGEHAQRLLITLNFKSKAEAEEALPNIEEAYQTAETSKRLLPDMVDNMGGVLEDLYIDSAGDDAVLVVPFRFKTTAQIMEEDDFLIKPFVFAVHLQMYDQLQWLAPLDADIPTLPSIN